MELQARIVLDPAAVLEIGRPFVHQMLLREHARRPWSRADGLPLLDRYPDHWMQLPDAGYLLAVDFIVHTLLRWQREHQQSARMHGALLRCLDMYHRAIEDLQAFLTRNCPPCADVATPSDVRGLVSYASYTWWTRHLPDPRDSPLPILMDQRPIAWFARCLPRILSRQATIGSSSSTATTATTTDDTAAAAAAAPPPTTVNTVAAIHEFQEGAPLVALFRKSWAQRHRTVDWVDKITHLIHAVEKKGLRDNEFQQMAPLLEHPPQTAVDVEVDVAITIVRRPVSLKRDSDATLSLRMAPPPTTTTTTTTTTTEPSAIGVAVPTPFADALMLPSSPTSSTAAATDPANPNRPRGYRRVATGMRMLRYLLQWACLFHLGAYDHSEVRVADLATRMVWCSIWRRLPTMEHAELLRQWERVSSLPALPLCIVNEFMIYCVRSDPTMARWLERMSAWRSYASKCLAFIDQYRRSLPYSIDPLEAARRLYEYELRRAQHKYQAKKTREQKRATRLQTTTPIARPKRSSGQKRPRRRPLEEEEEGDEQVLAPKRQRGEQGTAIPLERYDEVDHFVEKVDAVDTEFVQNMNDIYRNPALTQLVVFMRSVHLVGASTRYPVDGWEFLYHHMSRMDAPPLLSSDRRWIRFAPDSCDLRLAHFRRSQQGLPVTVVHRLMRDALDRSATLVRAAPTEAEQLALRTIRYDRHAVFLRMYRVLSLLFLAFAAGNSERAAVLQLVRDYHRDAMMMMTDEDADVTTAPPAVVIKLATLQKLQVQHPYAYALLFSAVMCWREWTLLWTVELPPDTTIRQRHAMTQLGLGTSSRSRVSWLLYCDACYSVHTVFDQHVASNINGLSFPSVCRRPTVSGFQNILVDVVPRDSSDVPGVSASAPFSLITSMFCAERSSRRVLQCATNPQRALPLDGSLAILNDRSYLMCADCCVIFECHPFVDQCNATVDRICPSCTYQVRLQTFSPPTSSTTSSTATAPASAPVSTPSLSSSSADPFVSLLLAEADLPFASTTPSSYPFSFAALDSGVDDLGLHT